MENIGTLLFIVYILHIEDVLCETVCNTNNVCHISTSRLVWIVVVCMILSLVFGVVMYFLWCKWWRKPSRDEVLIQKQNINRQDQETVSQVFPDLIHQTISPLPVEGYTLQLSSIQIDQNLFSVGLGVRQSAISSITNFSQDILVSSAA